MNQCSREASKGRLAKLDTSRPRGPASGKSCKEQRESPRRVYETGNVPGFLQVFGHVPVVCFAQANLGVG